MKYDVTYACGHVGVVDLIGKEKDRESELRWYESTAVCPECYKIKQEQLREKKRLERAEKIETENKILAHFKPCQLNGSPKQVAWAEDIRKELLIKSYKKGSDIARLLIAYLCHIETEARFYIDAKNYNSFQDVLLIHGEAYLEDNTLLPNKELLEKAEMMRDEIYVS